MPAASVLVLGGYGHFGRVVCRRLHELGFDVIVAGRDGAKAAAFARSIGARGVALDAAQPAFPWQLADSRASMVVSTAGPFQGQDYHVARAAIAAGAHYVDIADARGFVCGIGALDAAARAAGCLVVSGASSVPALSAAVVDRYLGDFRELTEIDAGISSSATPPGVATLRAVLGGCGKPLARWDDGGWTTDNALVAMRPVRFATPPMKRWISDCDVPDLALFPGRYPSLRSHRFGAGVASTALQSAVVALAGLVRRGRLQGLERAAGFLHAGARAVAWMGSRESAMFVEMRGMGRDGGALRRRWELRARSDAGANVPCMGAVALVRKLAAGSLARTGAMPCVGLLTLDEYLAELAGLPIEAALVA